MDGQRGDVRLQVAYVHMFDRAGGSEVEVVAASDRQAVINRPADQSVTETVGFAFFAEDSRLKRVVERIDEGRFVESSRSCGDFELEAVTEDSGDLEYAVRFGAEPRKTLTDNLADAFGNTPTAANQPRIGRIAPLRLEMVNDLLHVEGVAVGLMLNGFDQCCGNGAEAQRPDEGHRLLTRETAKRQGLSQARPV